MERIRCHYKYKSPGIPILMLVRVNMTNGQLPAGFQSIDTPLNLYDYEFCITNLREVPDDLDLKWLTGSYVIIEYSQLQTVPPALLRIMPPYFSLSGNPISELPPEVFEIEGLTDLGIGDTNIRELPRNVTQLSSTLTSIFVGRTNISYFWSVPRAIYAGGTTYCEDLEKILTKSANTFSAVPFPSYSSQLMDPTEAGPAGDIWAFVDCNPTVSGFSGPLYPLAAEDKQNRIHR
ncbi:Leucine-rich repeat domain, L domain-like [Phytophthora cactorum]|nr:Leucine-rich repeat domain, L domain-like [Phytophthora cactorum]